MFTLDLDVPRQQAHTFRYIYCLTDRKDKFETLEDETQKYDYRTLFRNICKDDKGKTVYLSATSRITL